jgi:hypothetical protein
MEKKEIYQFLAEKRKRMLQIFDDVWDRPSEWGDKLFRRMYNADMLLEEMKHVEEMLHEADDVKVLSLAELKVHVACADAIKASYDGNHCKVDNLVTATGTSYWVLYMTPDKALWEWK